MKHIGSLTAYFHGVLAELRKVAWPTLPQMLQYFVSVVIGIAITTAFVGSVDYVFVIYLLPLFVK